MNFLKYLFPPTEIKTNSLWENISSLSKSKFKIHDEICYKCKKYSKNFYTHPFCTTKTPLKQVITCFYYTNEIKPFLIKLKYSHNKNIAKNFANLMNIFLNLHIKDLKNTAISFVPMHWFKKYFIRWYNQAEILASYIAKQNNLPLIKICKKSKYTFTQTKTKNKKEREKNIKNSFKVNKIMDLNMDKIIIVDDIITTWTTLEEVAKCIKNIYPNTKVIWLVLARR